MRKFRDESGQVLVVVALSMTALLGFVGFATDVGLLLRGRRIAQTVADGAAIGAATESLYEGTPSTVSSGMWSAASQDAILNGFTPGSSNGVKNDTTGGTLTLNIGTNIPITKYQPAGYVQAVVTQNTPTMFMNLFGFHSMDVVATAIASDKIASNGCVNVADGGNNDPSDTVDLNGHSLISSPNCGVTIYGTESLSGSSTIDSKFTSVSATTPYPDQFAYLQYSYNLPTLPSGTVAGGNCTAPNGNPQNSYTSTMNCLYDVNISSTGVATPCAGPVCTISGNLQDNTIYYYDQNVSIAQNAQVIGTHDTIYLQGSTAVPAPYLDLMNGGINITPPGYGDASSTGNPCTDSTSADYYNPLCGVVIDAPGDGTTGGTYTCSPGHGPNTGNAGSIYFDFGSSVTTIYGVTYAPAMQLFVQDQGSSTSLYTDLTIGNICAQSATVTVYGFSGPGSPATRVGLVY